MNRYKIQTGMRVGVLPDGYRAKPEEAFEAIVLGIALRERTKRTGTSMYGEKVQTWMAEVQYTTYMAGQKEWVVCGRLVDAITYDRAVDGDRERRQHLVAQEETASALHKLLEEHGFTGFHVTTNHRTLYIDVELGNHAANKLIEMLNSLDSVPAHESEYRDPATGETEEA